MSSDLPGVNPATLNGILLYYRLMTKWSGLCDSTELSRVGLSHVPSSLTPLAQLAHPSHRPQPLSTSRSNRRGCKAESCRLLSPPLSLSLPPSSGAPTRSYVAPLGSTPVTACPRPRGICTDHHLPSGSPSLSLGAIPTHGLRLPPPKPPPLLLDGVVGIGRAGQALWACTCLMGQPGRRASQARKRGLDVVPGLQVRYDSPPQPNTKRPPCLLVSGHIDPSQIGLVLG
jgi:hypothetical protein